MIVILNDIEKYQLDVDSLLFLSTRTMETRY